MIEVAQIFAQIGGVLFYILKNTDNRGPPAGLSPAHGILIFLQFPALILTLKRFVNINPFTCRSP